MGAGAIGGVIGALLSRKGRNVELVDIAEDHVKKINQDGLTIKSQDETFTVPVKAYTPDQLLKNDEKVECILLCVKAQFTKDALTPLLPLLTDDSFVVSIQNGLCEIDIAEVVGEERTLGGFVNIFSDYIEPGVISYGGKGSVSVGELNGKYTPRLQALENELLALEQVKISENVYGYLWAKLAYGGILTATALTNEKMADVFNNRRYRVMLMNLAAEVLQVADYVGVKTVAFDDWNPDDAYPIESRDLDKMHAQLDIHVERLRKYTKVHSGIWRDIVVRKRKTEKPYHFKPIFNLAEWANIEMPLCRLLIDMLQEIENGEREMSTQNLDILLEKNNEVYR